MGREIDKMLATGLILLVEELDWINLIIIYDKKARGGI
jgi:hypothetical protein